MVTKRLAGGTRAHLRKTVLKHWVLERGQRRCIYCFKQLHYTHGHPQQASMDHIIPRSKGGKDKLFNILLCCTGCNQKRSDQSFKSFIKGLPREEWLLEKHRGAQQ